jgi:hypothetical protein
MLMVFQLLTFTLVEQVKQLHKLLRRHFLVAGTVEELAQKMPLHQMQMELVAAVQVIFAHQLRWTLF